MHYEGEFQWSQPCEDRSKAQNTSDDREIPIWDERIVRKGEKPWEGMNECYATGGDKAGKK
ncbi:hypothetical protein N7540_005154 [Penicillium herquei]|nr:hypothetical protein N7540_005154 [Penicillium herquei]